MDDESLKPAIKNDLNQEVAERTRSVVNMLESHMSANGFVPEVGKSSDGELFNSKSNKWIKAGPENQGNPEIHHAFNTELLGYSMRLAVEVDDGALFDRLYSSLDELTLPNGLLKARLHPDKSQDLEAGSSWADANQDVALALIEAGESWDNQTYLERGIKLAEAFTQSSHIKRLKNGTSLVFNTPEIATAEPLGPKMDAVDLSMLNFSLYTKMQRLSEANIWFELESSGKNLYEQALSMYQLIPNRLVLVDGKVTVLRSVKEDETLLSSIPNEDTRNIVREFRPEWNWDSMRTPFRLTDASLDWAKDLSDEIYNRLQKLGGPMTHIYADNGERHPDGEQMASAVAPLLSTIARNEGWENALLTLENSRKTQESSSMYMQLWQGLSLQQLRREVKTLFSSV